ncbi:hypothetical protein CRYPA_1402 [uncultured Candidatus Thioglobus sp.]|nr:hypothetical protein CRYPA_1402 [uncultured Candidatus Thioglobus sp.]
MKKSYGIALDYYPSVNTKLSASSQFERGNNINRLGVKHKHWFANVQRNTSQNTHKIELGLSFAFDSNFDFSTYSTNNTMPHLSELHRFEDIVLAHNMNIQNTKGVNRITPLSQPSISMADQSVDDDGGLTDRPLTPPVVSNIQTGAIYEIVSDPDMGLSINTNTGIMFWRGNEGGNQNFIITIKVINPDGRFATTSFVLTVVDTL